MVATVQQRPSAALGLQGADRVAAILLTMGKSLAGKLMKHFDPHEIKQITRSAADLRPVPAPQLRTLIEDFATQFALGANLVGNAGEVQRLLDGVLPKEQIEEIMGEIAGNPDRSIWERISATSEEALAGYLLREHPQTAALILARIKSASAARVISHLPADRRNGIIRRMLTVRPVVDETMRMFERILHQEFAANLARSAAAEGHARIAEIINKLDREHMDQVLQSLAATRPKVAEELKSQLFTFDDIARLPERARGALFDKMPSDRLVLALKGTTAEFRETVLSSLSGRVRKMIEQELNSGHRVPQREVTEARRVVTDLALEMANRGEIDLGNNEEEYVS
jgi:flagellar motor switch protein FliG